MRLVLAFVVLAGCLSKPDAPSNGQTGSDGSVDVPSDTPIDASPACTGTFAGPIPVDFRPERLARVVDFNRDGADDVIVFGQSGQPPNVIVRVYVIYGRPVMNLTCFDFQLSLSMSGDLLDVWVGDVSGDAIPDLGILAKTGTEFLVELHRGNPAGGVVAGTAQTVANTMFGLSPNAGGMPGSRSPIFLVGVREGADAGLMFGGVSQPWVVAPYNGTALGTMIQAGAIGTGAQFPELQPSEYVWAHSQGATQSDLLVATTAGQLRMLRLDGFGTSAELDLSAVSNVNVGIDGGGKDRTVRVWNRPSDPETTIAAMEGGSGIAIVRYRSFVAPSTAGFQSQHIDTPLDFDGNYNFVYDYAFGTIDGIPSDPIDVISLTGTNGTARRLNVHRNLDFAANPGGVAGRIGFEESLRTTNVSGGTLAVGNFDGVTNTPDQILVLGRPSGGSLGECYEIILPSSTSCIARCGETTCL